MSPYAQMCVIAIQSGRMTLSQVPARYRREVGEALNAE